jgi:alpha-mannosidase
MNNHWGTNYRAYQEGLTLFRFILRPFRSTTPDEATRFATGFSQPLIAVAASGGKVKSTPVLSVEPSGVIVTGFKPSDDGKAVIVRLFGASGKDCKVKLNWAEPRQRIVYHSDTSEKPLEKAGKDIEVPAWGIVTLRAER